MSLFSIKKDKKKTQFVINHFNMTDIKILIDILSFFAYFIIPCQSMIDQLQFEFSVKNYTRYNFN